MLTRTHAVPNEGTATTLRFDNRSSVLASVERTIDSAAKNGGYLWQQKLAVKRLADLIPAKSGLMLGTARSIYMALTEVASDQRTPTRARASNAYLAKLSGYSPYTVHRYLREFERIGIVTVMPSRGQYDPNTYLLLLLPLPSQPAAQLQAASLPLADAAGQSRGGTGATPPSPPSDGRGGTGARSEPLRGGMGATQIQNERVRTKKPNKQAGGVGLVVDDAGDDVGQQAMTSTSAPQPATSIQISQPATTLTAEQQSSLQQLTGIGVQRRVAEQLALTCSAEAVSGWVEYARTAKGISSPAGFVLAKLRAGDEPPRQKQTDPQNWVAEYAAAERKRQEEEARRLLTRYGVDLPTLELWLAVRDRLEADHEAAYYLCFKDALLAHPDVHTALLVLPPSASLEQAASYAPVLRELLATHMGAAVQLRFEHPHPGDESINFAAEAGEQATQPELRIDQPTPMQQVLQAAADELAKLLPDDAARKWLAQVRVVEGGGPTWVLRVPPGAESYALVERWGEQIVAALSAMLGQPVAVRFTTRG